MRDNYVYVSYKGTDEELREPHFDKAGRVHDWRNHVGENARRLWLTFTDEQRRALAQDADDSASNEHWD